MRYRRLTLPLSVVALLIIVHFLSAYGVIVPSSAIIEFLTDRLRSGSLLLIATISFFEGMVVFNAYFPGGGVILIAMASTSGNFERAILTFTAIVIGSGFAHQLDYWAGRLLGSRSGGVDNAMPTLLEAFASYWHPHSGSLYSLRSGSDGLSYARFAFRFSVAFGVWNIFWGVLMYQLGRVPISSSELLTLFYFYLGWWTIQELRLVRRVSRDSRTSSREPR